MTTDSALNWFDHEFMGLAARVERSGYTTMLVGYGTCSHPGCDGPPARYPYAYTIGLSRLQHPELVVIGLPRHLVAPLAHVVHEAAVAGAPLAVGRAVRHRLDDQLEFSLDPVPAQWLRSDPGRMAWWFNLNGGVQPPAVLQAVWTTGCGCVPWHTEPGERPPCLAQQPLLSEDPFRLPTPPAALWGSTRPPRRRRR